MKNYEVSKKSQWCQHLSLWFFFFSALFVQPDSIFVHSCAIIYLRSHPRMGDFHLCQFQGDSLRTFHKPAGPQGRFPLATKPDAFTLRLRRSFARSSNSSISSFQTTFVAPKLHTIVNNVIIQLCKLRLNSDVEYNEVYKLIFNLIAHS